MFSQLFWSHFWLKKIDKRGKGLLEKMKFSYVNLSRASLLAAAEKVYGLAENLRWRFLRSAFKEYMCDNDMKCIIGILNM